MSENIVPEINRLQWFPWPLWEVRIMGKRYAGGFFTKRGARKWIANYPEDFQ